MIKHAAAWIALSTLLLTACGGGAAVEPVSQAPSPGSPVADSGSPPPATPPPATTPPPTTSGSGRVALSWIPPTENEDGSTLTNLAGYRIFYGTSAGNLDRSVNLSNPGITRYVVENLPAGTWFFGIRAYSSAGAESVMSAIASRTIS